MLSTLLIKSREQTVMTELFNITDRSTALQRLNYTVMEVKYALKFTAANGNLTYVHALLSVSVKNIPISNIL